MVRGDIITEEQLVKIVEERGVAASPWKKEIDNIAVYIRKRVYSETKNGKMGKEIKFKVPSKICNVFPFLSEFKVSITALFAEENTKSGGGSFGGQSTSNFSKDLKEIIKKGVVVYHQDKLCHTEMKITCFYNSEGKVWLNSILGTFYHEINHAYDVWIDVHKTNNFNRYNKTALKSKLGVDLGKKYPCIGECIYRLFSETEYNALVASVFGDLQGHESQYHTFQNDYRYTQAYIVATEIKENIENELNSLTVDEAFEILKQMEVKEISLNMKKNTLKSFKVAFLAKTYKLLNELIQDIGRVASFYYDKKHEEEVYNNGQPLPTF